MSLKKTDSKNKPETKEKDEQEKKRKRKSLVLFLYIANTKFHHNVIFAHEYKYAHYY